MLDRPTTEHPDRAVLFANESFVIGMLQAVSGGTVVAGLAQGPAIVQLSNTISLLVLITGSLVSLCLALIAAYLKHQYKMWDVKRQSDRADSRLWAMRRCMLASLLVTVFSIAQLVVVAWSRVIPCGRA